MPRLTVRPDRLTTRKRAAAALASLLAAGLLALAGCATPGPNHTYIAATAGDPILDLTAHRPDAEISTHLFSSEALYGIAYDPFTDHLFVRLPPGNFVRVIDRPARKIKYDFTARSVPATGGGDLAIRSRDRHLFFAHPTQPVLIETTLYGDPVRDIRLLHLDGPPAGVAYDQKLNHFFILARGKPSEIEIYSLAGKPLGTVTLAHAVTPVSLAFDSIAREFYAPLHGESAIGVFDLKGCLLRTLPVPAVPAYDHVDVGERSFLRLF